MHASMPNASFNALLRSNCLRFGRLVFNICMGEIGKTRHGHLSFQYFVTMSFWMTSYFQKIPSFQWFAETKKAESSLPIFSRLLPMDFSVGSHFSFPVFRPCGQGRFKTNSRGASRETLPVTRISH